MVTILLLGEWTDAQRLLDSRTYKLMAIHMKDPPDAGLLFPSLRTSQPANVDDDSVFQQVAATLAPFNRQ